MKKEPHTNQISPSPPPDFPADEFRALNDVTKPDVRQTYFVVSDPESGEWVKKEIRHLHWSVSQYALGKQVPQEIHVQWDTARNIWLYGWFVYRFYTVAELQAYVVLELALRQKLGHTTSKPPGLKKLISDAIEKKLVFDECIEQYRQIKDQQTVLALELEKIRSQIPRCNIPAAETVERDPQSQKYCTMLSNQFPKLRNMHAHGGTYLYPASVGLAFGICRDIINQLLDRK